MTLIEILFYYRDVLRAKGRKEANAWLNKIVYEIEDANGVLYDCIRLSCNDAGQFITSESYVFDYKKR